MYWNWSIGHITLAQHLYSTSIFQCTTVSVMVMMVWCCFFIHFVCACWINKFECIWSSTCYAINITPTKALQMNSLVECTEYVIWLSNLARQLLLQTMYACWMLVLSMLKSIDNLLRYYDENELQTPLPDNYLLLKVQ